MTIDDSKFEIFVDGKNIYAGAPVEFTMTEDKLQLETEIGKTTKQKLKIIITKMNYVETIEESTNKNEDTNE